MVPGRDGRGLPQAPLLGAAEARPAAQRVLPRALLGLVPGGSGRPRPRRADGAGRPVHVGQRLSAPRGHLAPLRGGDRAHHGAPLGLRARRRARAERGALLRPRGAAGAAVRSPA